MTKQLSTIQAGGLTAGILILLTGYLLEYLRRGPV